MGEYADYILKVLNGDNCVQCVTHLGNGEGFPRLCSYCKKHSNDPMPGEKTVCPKCKKSVKAIGLKDHMRDAHKEA